jgi:hypothetical protein
LDQILKSTELLSDATFWIYLKSLVEVPKIDGNAIRIMDSKDAPSGLAQQTQESRGS